MQFGDGKKISGEAGGAEIEGQLGGLIWAALELSTPIQELSRARFKQIVRVLLPGYHCAAPRLQLRCGSSVVLMMNI